MSVYPPNCINHFMALHFLLLPLLFVDFVVTTTRLLFDLCTEIELRLFFISIFSVVSVVLWYYVWVRFFFSMPIHLWLTGFCWRHIIQIDLLLLQINAVICGVMIGNLLLQYFFHIVWCCCNFCSCFGRTSIMAKESIIFPGEWLGNGCLMSL